MRVLASRRRHRDLVRLLSTPLDGAHGADLGRHTGLGDQLDDAHVIEHDAPLAYCLPGRTNARSVTVLSRGLLDQLSQEELAAVVAHERTHLQQRHHLLTMAFDAWYRALPWLPTTRYGREASWSSPRCSPTTVPPEALTGRPAPLPGPELSRGGAG